MDDQTLLELVASILEVEAGDISLTDNLEEREWDSLANLSFIAEMDERLGLTIDADELAKAETVGDLRSIVAAASA